MGQVTEQQVMVAPNYAATRSKLAKMIGLGRKTGTKMKARRKA